MSTPDGVLDRLNRRRDELSQHTPTAKQVVLGAITLTVVVLMVVPLAFLLWTSVWSGFPGEFGAEFTLDNFQRVYFRDAFDVPDLLTTSLILAVAMTVTGLIFGLTFAWLFVRTNLPTKGTMELVLLSGQAVPGYIYAFMYITAYDADTGLVATRVQETAGVGMPLDMSEPWGVGFIAGIAAVPTFYLLIVPAVQDMNPELEEVSRIHGANVPSTLRAISLPLIKPAILSAVLVILLYGLGEFSVVAILGTRGGIDVYSTEIFEAVRVKFPPAYGEAAALACSLLLVMLVLVIYYRSTTSRKKDFMTVTGSGHRNQRWDLGKWRWPLALGLWTALFVVWIIPALVLVLTSLHGTWLGQIDLSALTLSHYTDAVTDDQLRKAFVNSLIVAGGGATLGTLLVVGLAYYTERTKARFRGLVDFLSLTPLAVPGIIMGGALLFMFLWIGNFAPVLSLYGTLGIIIIGCIIVFIPVSSRIAIGNIVQIHSELEEAARVSGASWLQQMREVFLPLFRNTIVVIWFFLAVHIFQLLSVPAMTYTVDTVVIPIELFDMYSYDANLAPVSAVSTILIVLTMLVVVGLRWLGVTFYELGNR